MEEIKIHHPSTRNSLTSNLAVVRFTMAMPRTIAGQTSPELATRQMGGAEQEANIMHVLYIAYIFGWTPIGRRTFVRSASLATVYRATSEGPYIAPYCAYSLSPLRSSVHRLKQRRRAGASAHVVAAVDGVAGLQWSRPVFRMTPLLQAVYRRTQRAQRVGTVMEQCVWTLQDIALYTVRLLGCDLTNVRLPIGPSQNIGKWPGHA
jgi:hypothetical protein